MMVAGVVYNYSQANIPLETMWTDIDYSKSGPPLFNTVQEVLTGVVDLRRTWTLDPDRFPLHKMQELVTYLHDHNQSYIMMVDPPVALNDSQSYNRALQDDVFIKHENGTNFVGAMWPGATSFVDWLHPNAQSFWSRQVNSFFNENTGVDVDGIWIDMNDVWIC
jgi:alpha-glucosidase